MTVKKPKPNDWQARDISDWITTTFRQYMNDVHEEHYGVPYMCRSYAIEGKWLKAMIAEHGPEITRAFIDECFGEYKPTPQYPGLNFSFMHTYMRPRVLPRIIAQQARKQNSAANATQVDELSEADLDWL